MTQNFPLGATVLGGVADCSGYKTQRFVTCSEPIRSHPDETKAISSILKIIRKEHFVVGSGEMNVFLVHSGSRAWSVTGTAERHEGHWSCTTTLHAGLPALGLIL